MDGSHSGRLVGSHRDSSRDVADQDTEKCRSNQQKSSAPTLCVGRTAKRDESDKVKDQPPVLKYIKTQVGISDIANEVLNMTLGVKCKGAYACRGYPLIKKYLGCRKDD